MDNYPICDYESLCQEEFVIFTKCILIQRLLKEANYPQPTMDEAWKLEIRPWWLKAFYPMVAYVIEKEKLSVLTRLNLIPIEGDYYINKLIFDGNVDNYDPARILNNLYPALNPSDNWKYALSDFASFIRSIVVELDMGRFDVTLISIPATVWNPYGIPFNAPIYMIPHLQKEYERVLDKYGLSDRGIHRKFIK